VGLLPHRHKTRQKMKFFKRGENYKGFDRVVKIEMAFFGLPRRNFVSPRNDILLRLILHQELCRFKTGLILFKTLVSAVCLQFVFYKSHNQNIRCHGEWVNLYSAPQVSQSKPYRATCFCSYNMFGIVFS